jgi:folate-binding protein YgfZ
MQAAPLPDRGIVHLAGDDTRHFLHGLLTADVAALAPGAARFAALLTPQGKIVADMLVAAVPDEDGGGILLDVPRALVDTLLAKLKLYRLRAKVTIEDRSAALAVVALWADAAEATTGAPAADRLDGLLIRDPRHPRLGWRAVVPADAVPAAVTVLAAIAAEPAAWEAHRIGLDVPRGGVDFAYGDTFPHEADMDQLGGVDFAKGCYVGQEVVSRMQHRGTARTRVVPVALDGFGPPPGTPVTAGELAVGTMGSSVSGRGLAMLRLDRVADAMAAGTPLLAGGIALTPQRPDWATFAWPGGTAETVR